MNRTTLTQAVATELKCSKLQADGLVKTVLTMIEDGLRKDGHVTLTGFGTFRRVKRAARTGRNPHTGGAVQIPEGYRVHFAVSQNSPLRKGA